MKIISYTALHYGVDYLEYAIRSVIDHVDEHWVLYTPIGSHGHRTDRVCPDSRDDLYAAAKRGAGDKLRWVENTWAYEGQQRESIHQYAPDADVILVVDADEVWADDLAFFVVDGIMNRWPKGQARTYRIPIIHYWRSFYRCVLHDPAFPVRAIVPKSSHTHEATINGAFSGDNPLKINHMGYAQRSEIVEYKQHTHGHRGEWRCDVDWFNDKFLANAQHDTHPVGSEYWNPEQVNPLDYMPEWMADHPYFNMEVIP